jgi:hypothetical protein
MVVLVLPINIRQGLICLLGNKILAYYEQYYITVVKSFIVLGPEHSEYQHQHEEKKMSANIQVMPFYSQAKPGQARPSQAKPGQARPSQATPYQTRQT